MEEGEKQDMVPGTKVRGVDMTEQGNHESGWGRGEAWQGWCSTAWGLVETGTSVGSGSEGWDSEHPVFEKEFGK